MSTLHPKAVEVLAADSVRPAPPSPFSKTVPTLQIAWDSTSLGLLKTCPRKYQLAMIDQWTSKGTALPLYFGIEYHKALEEYDIAKAKGASHEEAVHYTLRNILQRNVNFVSDDTKRNKATLIRAVVWYLDHFRDDPTKTIILESGKPAVELSFKFTLGLYPESTEEEFILCGHLDRLVEFQDQIYVQDRKTTGSSLSSQYFERYNPDNQMTLYTYAANVVLDKSASGVIIDAVQLAVGFARFQRGVVTRTKSQLNEWAEDLGWWLRQAERFATAGYWPMNDTACDKFGGCGFRGICSKDKAVRDLFLKSDFTKREWNPLDNRGE